MTLQIGLFLIVSITYLQIFNKPSLDFLLEGIFVYSVAPKLNKYSIKKVKVVFEWL